MLRRRRRRRAAVGRGGRVRAAVGPRTPARRSARRAPRSSHDARPARVGCRHRPLRVVAGDLRADDRECEGASHQVAARAAAGPGVARSVVGARCAGARAVQQPLHLRERGTSIRFGAEGDSASAACFSGARAREPQGGAHLAQYRRRGSRNRPRRADRGRQGTSEAARCARQTAAVQLGSVDRRRRPATRGGIAAAAASPGSRRARAFGARTLSRAAR